MLLFRSIHDRISFPAESEAEQINPNFLPSCGQNKCHLHTFSAAFASEKSCDIALHQFGVRQLALDA